MKPYVQPVRKCPIRNIPSTKRLYRPTPAGATRKRRRKPPTRIAVGAYSPASSGLGRPALRRVDARVDQRGVEEVSGGVVPRGHEDVLQRNADVDDGRRTGRAHV